MKLLLALMCVAPFALPQATNYSARRIQSGTALPATCNPNPPFTDVFIKTNVAITVQEYVCTSANTWTQQGTSGSATWGSITGTLSNQTDLQTALNGKLAVASNLSDVASVATSRANLGIGSISHGTFASLNQASCATGDYYVFEDSLYTNALCTATNTWAFYADGKKWTLPSSVLTSWSNQSTATLSETNGYSVISVPSSHGGGLAARYGAISALSTFTHTFLFRINLIGSSSGVNRMAVVMLSDASKCMLISPYTNSATSTVGADRVLMTITTYTDTSCTMGAANPVSDAQISQLGDWFYMQVVEDSTNLTVNYGTDGNNWTQWYQASKTAFFGSGATRLGFGGYKATATQLIQLVGYN